MALKKMITGQNMVRNLYETRLYWPLDLVHSNLSNSQCIFVLLLHKAGCNGGLFNPRQ